LSILVILAGFVVSRGGRITSTHGEFAPLPPQAVVEPAAPDAEPLTTPAGAPAEPADPDEIIAIGPVA
jgi:hypothetical protein